MSNIYRIKQGDIGRTYQAVLTDADGDPIDLTDADVKLIVRRRPGDVLLEEDATIVGDPTAGTVKYVWADGDTDTPGRYAAEFEVTWTASDRVTVPTRTPGIIEIVPKLNTEA